MALTTTVDATAAREALGAIVPQVTRLIRSISDPCRPALGEWNTGQVALHLAHAWERLPALALGVMEQPIDRVEELAALTTAMVRDDPRTDPACSAARIEAAAAAYLSTPPDGVEPRPWLLRGAMLPGSAFTCHLLNESLVHGFDIARAERRPWRIDPAHAGMALTGFLLRAMQVADPRAPVDQERAAGVRACFDVRVRRTTRFYLQLEDGALSIEPPSSRRVDWHFSAEPSTLFLTLWSRISPLPGLLSGRLVGWGRRPDLGLRLTSMLRNP